MTSLHTPAATSAGAAHTADAAAVEAAERRVHAAERWLDATRQSGIEEWIAGASAKLHEAIREYFRLGGTWSRQS